MAASLGKHVCLLRCKNLVYLQRCTGRRRAKTLCDSSCLLGASYSGTIHSRRYSQDGKLDPDWNEENDPGPVSSAAKNRQPRWAMMRERISRKYNLDNPSTTSTNADMNDSYMDSKRAKNDNTEGEIDFFGIGNEGNEMELRRMSQNASHQQQVTAEKIENKFTFLRNPTPTKYFEKVYDVPFGMMRLDKDNRPRYHGEMERYIEKVEETETALSVEDDMVYEKVIYENPSLHDSVEDISLKAVEESHSQAQAEISSQLEGLEGTEYIEEQYFQYEGVSHQNEQVEENEYTDDHYFGTVFKNGNNSLENSIVHQNEQGNKYSLGFSNKKDLEKENIFDEQYFPQAINNESNSELSVSAVNNIDNELQEKKLSVKDNEEENFFDEQYFSGAFELEKKNGDNMSRLVENSKHLSSVETANEAEASSLFDEQYFGAHIETGVKNADKCTTGSNSLPQFKEVNEIFQANFFNSNDNTSVESDKFKGISQDENRFGSLGKSQIKEAESEPYDDQPVKKKSKLVKETIFVGSEKESEQSVNQPQLDFDNPQTPYEIAMKIRLEAQGKLNTEAPSKTTMRTEDKFLHPKLANWTGATDSKGFRILKHQVLDIQSIPEDDVVHILKNSILYEDEELVVLDKPYGLPSHGGPSVHHSVGKLLPQLARKLNSNLENLQLIHRLDKETTGIMVVAKNKQAAWKLHGMFKRREVVKKYWVLTKGVPNPLEGVIDIPMAEGKVGNQYRMALRPDNSPQMKGIGHPRNHKEKFDAITNYKVLNSYNSCALVECQPESGVKHQIRCHMAFALNTPILGDHKYSHFSKMAPQRLYADMLQKLHIRQATVRYLPMHLHAKVLILPEAKNGRNLFISARLPKHFLQNMKWLKIKTPSDIKY